MPNVNLNNAPSDAINATNCLEVDFTAVDPTESGLPQFIPDVLITSVHVANVVNGSTMKINDNVFTFNPTSDPELNQISTTGTLLTDIFNELQNNYYAQQIFDFTASSINPTVIGLKRRRSTTGVVIKFEGLGASAADIVLTYSETPFTVRPGFSAIVCVTNESTNEMIGEERFYLRVNANESETDIVSQELKGDLGEIVKSGFSTPLPVCTDASLNDVEEVTTMISRINFTYCMAHGNPLTKYEYKTDASAFYVVPAERLRGEGSLAGYAPANGQKFYNLGNNSRVTCNQPFWLYMALTDEYTTYVPQLSWSAYDFSGNLIGGDFLLSPTGPLTPDYGQDRMLVIQAGIPQIRSLLTTGGVTDTEFKSMGSIVFDCSVVNSANPVETYNTETFTLRLDHGRDSANFVFRNHLGSFSSISLVKISSKTYTTVQEFVELCDPCHPGNNDIKFRNISSNVFIDLEFGFFENSFYDTQILEDFFASEEIYWRVNNDYYFVQNTTTENVTFRRFSSSDPVFKCRMFR